MTTKSSHNTPARPAPRKVRPPARVPFAPAHPRCVPIDALDDRLDGEADTSIAEGALNGLDPELRYRMISEAAYNLYQDRGFADGYELDDWLQAEAAVDHLLVNPKDVDEASAKE